MAILFKSWGNHLRWGNWSFLLSGLSVIAKKSGNKLYLPENYFAWQYLLNPPLIDSGMKVDEVFHFRQTHYTEEEFNYLINYFTENKDRNVEINLGAHLQSELFIQDEIEFVKSLFEIKEEAKQNVFNKYKHIFGNGKQTIGIGIRRGDFKNHGCFFQIPEKWYLQALEKEFPNWKECNVLFFSDDIEECKTIFKGENFYFAEKNGTHTHKENFKFYHGDCMEQFIMAYFCSGMVIGSSTFSYWQAWIVDKFNNGKIVHSSKNLDGECLQKFYNPDYYCKNWTTHPIENEK